MTAAVLHKSLKIGLCGAIYFGMRFWIRLKF